ncbi:hypothetical protein V6000_007111 [Aspergillus fumigatus]
MSLAAFIELRFCTAVRHSMLWHLAILVTCHSHSVSWKPAIASIEAHQRSPLVCVFLHRPSCNPAARSTNLLHTMRLLAGGVCGTSQWWGSKLRLVYLASILFTFASAETLATE